MLAANDAPREQVLDVTEFESLNGSTHEILPDKSVLLSGETPDKDTYTVKVKLHLRNVRAIKLETLTGTSEDAPRLPSGMGELDLAQPVNRNSVKAAGIGDLQTIGAHPQLDGLSLRPVVEVTMHQSIGD